MPDALPSASRVTSAVLSAASCSIKRLSSRRKNSSSRLRPRSRKISGGFVILFPSASLVTARACYPSPRVRDLALEQLAIDCDEHHGLPRQQPVHPDRRRHRSRSDIDALPQAPGWSTLTPARGRLPLAFLEAIRGQRSDDLVGSRDPAALGFEPGHPTLSAKVVHGVHRLHTVASPLQNSNVECLIHRRSHRSPPQNLWERSSSAVPHIGHCAVAALSARSAPRSAATLATNESRGWMMLMRRAARSARSFADR